VRHALPAVLLFQRQGEITDTLVELLNSTVHRVNARAETECANTGRRRADNPVRRPVPAHLATVPPELCALRASDLTRGVIHSETIHPDLGAAGSVAGLFVEPSQRPEDGRADEEDAERNDREPDGSGFHGREQGDGADGQRQEHEHAQKDTNLGNQRRTLPCSAGLYRPDNIDQTAFATRWTAGDGCPVDSQ
jgi:hypothetical protein